MIKGQARNYHTNQSISSGKKELRVCTVFDAVKTNNHRTIEWFVLERYCKII